MTKSVSLCSVILGMPARVKRCRFTEPQAAACQGIIFRDWCKDNDRAGLSNIRALETDGFIEKHRD